MDDHTQHRHAFLPCRHQMTITHMHTLAVLKGFGNSVQNGSALVWTSCLQNVCGWQVIYRKLQTRDTFLKQSKVSILFLIQWNIPDCAHWHENTCKQSQLKLLNKPQLNKENRVLGAIFKLVEAGTKFQQTSSSTLLNMSYRRLVWA